MIRAVVGTAGHIDHGKTALVRALTGTDTDRLKEERERGITIDLGFAEIPPKEPDGVALGVVDVPGHEDFVRTMVAGASGLDLALLVVAADEGVMPQTREHLAILGFLEVPALVVALTKCDLVEEDWIELVEEEVRETLVLTRHPEAPLVRVSSRTGQGLDELRRLLSSEAGAGGSERADDLLRLPVDRSFSVHGTGTVVTGTLWSGRLESGTRLRVLPQELEARVRGLQVHGAEVTSVEAGTRTAVALVGPEIHPDRVGRGSTLVAGDWPTTSILTARVRVLPDTGWRLEHNQRVHLHLGTQEVRARCALLRPSDVVDPGETGWLQLRLETPVVARARDRVVLRSFSPVTTIAGGRIAEPLAPKRTSWPVSDAPELTSILDGPDHEVLASARSLAGWHGLARERLPVVTGLAPCRVRELLDAGGSTDEPPDQLFGAPAERAADEALRSGLAELHRRRPLRSVVPLSELRAVLPAWAHPELADQRIAALETAGALVCTEGGVRQVDWVVDPSPDERALLARLRTTYRDADLQPPERSRLPSELAEAAELDELLQYLVDREVLVSLTSELWIDRQALDAAAEAVRRELGGREGLGPSDFREALPVTRKHLLPILGYLDGAGITRRTPSGRSVLA